TAATCSPASAPALCNRRGSLPARYLGWLLRLDVGDRWRVLELAEIIARLRLEAREVFAAQRRTQGELLGQRIDRCVAAIELVVQVRAGRHAGRTDEADHLAL